jgi:hypothetical protein
MEGTINRKFAGNMPLSDLTRSFPRRIHAAIQQKAGLLTYGPSYLHAFPFPCWKQWHGEEIPELQWRDRAGITPASLLSSKLHDSNGSKLASTFGSVAIQF